MFRPQLPVTRSLLAFRPLQQVANYIVPTKQTRIIKAYEPLQKGPKPLITDIFKAQQYERLDPTQWRRRLISPDSPASERVRTGDVLRVMYTSRAIPPFVGQVIAISKKGIDANLTLRNTISKIGVENKVKLFSPLIARIDIIRRPHQYKRRNRQYYIRGNRLDVGDLEASLRRRS